MIGRLVGGLVGGGLVGGGLVRGVVGGYGYKFVVGFHLRR